LTRQDIKSDSSEDRTLRGRLLGSGHLVQICIEVSVCA
jgi:hypothetical protein